MFTLHAAGVGAGIAIGPARILRRARREIPEFAIADSQIDAEIARLHQAIERARASLRALCDGLGPDSPAEVGELLGMHLAVLDDPTLRDQPSALIRDSKLNAEAALAKCAADFAHALADVDDPYLRKKSADVAQVVHRIHGELLRAPDDLGDYADGALEGAVVVANDLTPADAIALKRQRIGAFLTNLGGPISHTAILARSLRIPAIVGLHGAIRYLRDDDVLVIDGKRGVALVNPDASALAAYRRRREKIARRAQALDALREVDAVTLDGEAVSLLVNIELPDEAMECARCNAHGVGLYRTEFLFMNRARLPDEDEQYEAYAEVVRRAGAPVTIRTLDLGADKQVDGGRASDSISVNPALGRRALRLCLHDIALFKPQLRAIYRAAALGPVRIMVPMFTSMEELHQLFALLDQVKHELADEGVAHDPNAPVGGMVEVPAAAVAADLFARHLDFLSIGTNDLIQYTLAIDRIDDEVNYLYDPLHPAVLRLIQSVIDAGREAKIPVGMCGEMAGDPAYTRILLGMGLREFSMDPASLLEVKRQVRLSDAGALAGSAARLLRTIDPAELRALAAEMA